MIVRLPTKFELFQERMYIFLFSWICYKFNICCYCFRRRAVWYYMPSWYLACDECVPRGCSCNMEPIDDNYEDPSNWEEPVDELGRKYPCCEWMKFQR